MFLLRNRNGGINIWKKYYKRAVLVGVNVGNEDDFAYSMEELTNLAEACDVEVVGK